MPERILRRPMQEDPPEDINDILHAMYSSPSAQEAVERYHDLTPQSRIKYKTRKHGSTHPTKEIRNVRPAQPIFKRK